MIKFARGIIGLFLISFCFYSIISIYSCSNDEFLIDENYIVINKNPIQDNLKNNEATKIPLTNDDLIDIDLLSYNSFVTALNNALPQIEELISQGDLNTDEEEAFNALQPVFVEARQFILNHGMSIQEFEMEFDGDFDDRIITTGLLMISSYRVENKGDDFGFIDFIMPSMYGQMNSNDILVCLSVALGVTALNAIISAPGKLLTATKALQIIKIVGKRYLGYLGVVVAIKNFISCMNTGNDSGGAE